MFKENPDSDEWNEALMRLEEIIAHPADLTFSSLQDQEMAAKKELSRKRNDLSSLLASLPKESPKPGTEEHKSYQRTQKQIQILKERIAKKHDELMDILKNEEKISREFQNE